MSKACEKCGSSIPNRIEIEGKIRNVANRKFCLECSPFGKHNTRDLNKPPGRKKRYTKEDAKKFSEAVKRWRKRTKRKAIEYKGGKCIVCGYDRCPNALDFHHLDPDEKEIRISSGNTRGWEIIKTELDKCVLLCCRCHREVHANVTILGLPSPAEGNWLLTNRVNTPSHVQIVPPEPEENYKIRRREKRTINLCLICHKETTNKKYCSHKCSNLAHRKAERPSREQLAKDIRTMPMTKVGQKYGVSDNAIRKWIKPDTQSPVAPTS